MKTFDSHFFGESISDNLIESPEGYLICKDVKIARTGTQVYLGQELGETDKYNQKITVYRLADDVFDAQTLASFEGKSVVDDHPSTGVSVGNHSAYAKGHAQNIRKDGDYIIADLVISDPILIQKVRDNLKREVSCGYNCSYEPYKDGYRQTNIIGNHIAVVERGRAGNKVRINDALNLGDIPVNKNQALLKLITHYAKDHSVEEVETVAELVFDNAPKKDDTLFDRLSKVLGVKAKDEAYEGKETEKEEEEEEEKKEEKKTDDRLARLEDMVSRLLKDADEEEKKETEDEEEMMDEEVEASEEEKKQQKKSEDSIRSEILSQLKPAIAKLSAKDKKAFMDELRPAKPAKTSSYAAIKKAASTHAKDYQAVDESYANVGMDIAKKFNPHFKESK